jgi:hypothetical protein
MRHAGSDDDRGPGSRADQTDGLSDQHIFVIVTGRHIHDVERVGMAEGIIDGVIAR